MKREGEILGYNSVHLTEKRLHRVICNKYWIYTCSSISCSTRPYIDHTIFLFFMTFKQPLACIFQFLKMWSHHNDYSNLVKTVWNNQNLGSSMFVLSQNLKLLKDELKICNKNIFGNIHLEVANATKKLVTMKPWLKMKFVLSLSQRRSLTQRKPFGMKKIGSSGIVRLTKTRLSSIRLLNSSKAFRRLTP